MSLFGYEVHFLLSGMMLRVVFQNLNCNLQEVLSDVLPN